MTGALDAAKGSQVEERFEAGVGEDRADVCCVTLAADLIAQLEKGDS